MQPSVSSCLAILLIPNGALLKCNPFGRCGQPRVVYLHRKPLVTSFAIENLLLELPLYNALHPLVERQRRARRGPGIVNDLRELIFRDRLQLAPKHPTVSFRLTRTTSPPNTASSPSNWVNGGRSHRTLTSAGPGVCSKEWYARTRSAGMSCAFVHSNLIFAAQRRFAQVTYLSSPLCITALIRYSSHRALQPTPLQRVRNHKYVDYGRFFLDDQATENSAAVDVMLPGSAHPINSTAIGGLEVAPSHRARAVYRTYMYYSSACWKTYIPTRVLSSASSVGQCAQEAVRLLPGDGTRLYDKKQMRVRGRYSNGEWQLQNRTRLNEARGNVKLTWGVKVDRHHGSASRWTLALPGSAWTKNKMNEAG